MPVSRAETRFLVRFGELNFGERILDALGLAIGLDLLDLAGMDPFGAPRTGTTTAPRERGIVELVDRSDDRVVWRARDEIDVVRSLHDRITHALREVSAEAFRAEWDVQ